MIMVYYSGWNSGRAKWKRSIGQGLGGGAQSIYVLSGRATFQAHQCVHQCGSSLSFLFQEVFFFLSTLYLLKILLKYS